MNWSFADVLRAMLGLAPREVKGHYEYMDSPKTEGVQLRIRRPGRSYPLPEPKTDAERAAVQAAEDKRWRRRNR